MGPPTRKSVGARGAGAGSKSNKGHKGHKGHKGQKRTSVPLPVRDPSSSEEEADDSVDWDDEAFEMLDDVGTGGLEFLSGLPTKELNDAVSQAREKKAVPRHRQGEDPRIRGIRAVESDDAGDSDDLDDMDSDGMGDGDPTDSEEEAWERGPRGRAGTGGVVLKRPRGSDLDRDRDGASQMAMPRAKKPSVSLPVKLNGSMVHVDANANEGLLDAIDAHAFEGVTVLDDGTSSKAEEKRRKAAALESERRAAEAAREAMAREAMQAKDASLREIKRKEKENADEKYKDDALKVLLGCRSKAQRREKAKMVIAKAAQTLLGEPERQLRKQMPILLELVADLDVHVSKLSMLSIFAVMRDVIPSYKIRPQHEREKESQDVVQSKEVKELWAHENALLKAYQSYLKVLLKAFKGQKENPKSKSALTMGRAAAKCLASLITALPHFNFSGDILQVIVPGIANKDAEIKKACAGAISALVKDGLTSAESGQAAVEATQLLADFAKRRNCTGLPPEIVSCLIDFTFPDILSADDLAEAKRSRKSKKKKGKKKGKDERDVNRAFKEAQAVIDKDTRRHQQSVVLEAMFEMYFRVLKTTEQSLSGDGRNGGDGHVNGNNVNVTSQWSHARFQKRFPLLAPTLQGLAKFAHLISIDYFQDIITTLEDILESPCVPHDIRCRCLLTASEIAKGQGGESFALNIDRAALYKELYKAMYSTMEIPLEDDDHTTYPALLSRQTFHDGYPGSALSPPVPFEETPPVLLAKVLDDMLLDSRKTLDIHRQAAFTKRAATIALQTTDSGLALTMLYVIYRMLKRYPKLRSMIEEDEGAGPSTSYYGAILNKACTSVEFADQDPSMHEGALYTPLWELSILAGHHSNPGVRKAAEFVSLMSVAAARAAATGETGEQAHALGSIFGSGSSTPGDVCLYSSTGRGAFVPTVRAERTGRTRRATTSKSIAPPSPDRWVGVLCGSPLPFPTLEGTTQSNSPETSKPTHR